MIPASVLGGRLVYSNHFLTSVVGGLDATEYALITEAPAAMTQAVSTNNGGSLEQAITAANSVGSYGDFSSIKLVRIPQLANLEFLGRVNIPSDVVEQYFFVNVRSDAVAATASDANCYGFDWVCNGGDGNINQKVASTSTFLIGDDQTATIGDWWMRGYIRGTSMGVRVWLASAEEPARFATVVDAALPGRGFVSVGLIGGAGGADDNTYDLQELHVWNLDGPHVGAIARVL